MNDDHVVVEIVANGILLQRIGIDSLLSLAEIDFTALQGGMNLFRHAEKKPAIPELFAIPISIRRSP